MDDLSIIEKSCAFCCGIMAEMGNLLEMSYQKVNVILFCWVEPGICLGLWFVFLWGCLHFPWSRSMAWVSLVFNSLLIVASAVLLCISAIILTRHMQGGVSDPMSIINLNEADPLFVNKFNETVLVLSDVGQKLGISYAAVNLLYYVLLLPIGIILGYYGIIKNLLR